MNGPKVSKSAFLKASVAGILAVGAFAVFNSGAGAEGMAAAPGVPCYGVNACKGTGDCGGKGHACAGKNACKGMGFKNVVLKEDCLKMEGGRLTLEQ